ncbi:MULTISPECIES: DUF4302 domain-containing protein [unclassified Myroides]|uniref:DUF4302 domain-containing protein n=1 Tax=unclassified Myroides TaxID=2642485 RepID=UPI003D2F99E5
MMKRLLNIGVLSLLISGAIVSCKSDDGVFSQNPIEREQEQAKELKDLLVGAKDGWKFQYFTQESALGGFTFLMTFEEDGHVTMVSDHADEGFNALRTEYEIQLRGTTSLVFVDKSWIHELSDPTKSALRIAKGFEGEFQYRYNGHDENSIFFKGTRDINKNMSFVRATSEDWKNFEDRKEAIKNIGNEDVPIFRSLEVDKAGVVTKYDATYSGVLRFLEFNVGDSQDLIPGKKGVGIGFTNTGLYVQPAIDVDGEQFSDFNWNESTKEFVSSNGSGTAVKIKNVKYPEVWTDEYKSYMFANRNTGTGFIKEHLMSAPSNSEKFLRLIRPIALDRIQFQFGRSSVEIEYQTPSGNFTYIARLTDTGKSGKMSNGSWATSNVPNNIKELHDELFGYGDLMLKEQTYNVKFTNKVVTIYCGGVVMDTYKF